MTKPLFFNFRRLLQTFRDQRWPLILFGLAVQATIIATTWTSLQQPALPDIALAPILDKPGICRVVNSNPFSGSSAYNLPEGAFVRPFSAHGTILDCTDLGQIAHVQVLGQAHPLTINITPLPVNPVDIILTLTLLIIFSFTGIAIYLRSRNRPTARVAYALFFCTSLMFYLFNLHGSTYLWVNGLLFSLAMIARGLSTTFVCLFPVPDRQGSPASVSGQAALLPYLPLLSALVLTAVGLPLTIFMPQMRIWFGLLTLLYNLVCLIVVIWVLVWGLRRVDKSELQFARMMIVGIIFLLLPLAFSLNIINTNPIALPSLIRLLPLPLVILPLACDYALFRDQLLGTTSLLGRKAMRVLLWLLLASLFVFPAVIFLHTISEDSAELRDYLTACLLLLCLCLFPLAWRKVRETGDHVFYHDFYQYNRSLSELSSAMTRLQGIDQISAFILPRLSQLLNARNTALLLRGQPRESALPNSGGTRRTPFWQIYRDSNSPAQLPAERLTGIANLALTHLHQPTTEPLLLDGVLLLGLYAGERLNGFLCLGPKRNLEPYDRQDASFLSTLAAQLSVLEVNSRYLEQAQADTQQLAALNHRVISAQEEERRHLALELHDEALQQAMLAVRQLSDASTMTDVAEVMPLARSVVTSLRHTCLELRPPLLDELGLEEALRWLARQTEQRSIDELRVHVICTVACVQRPPAHVELALYRVCQEALSNALKYADASRVQIRLRVNIHGSISLIIADNGQGLQTKYPQAESLGLVGMHERMSALGGTLQIRTSPGQGVLIRACCPPTPLDPEPLLSSLVPENQPVASSSAAAILSATYAEGSLR